MPNSIGAAAFKADCLKLIEQMTQDGQPVTILKRGRPVATLTPIAAKQVPFVGALRGTVLHYDDPFSPATDPSDWNAVG